MKLCSIASGSKGNSTYIESKDTKILIDAGLSGVAIQRNLEAIGVDPSTLDAIFVTHEHMDHIKGVGVLARRFQLDVFANENTWLAMDKTVGKINSTHMHRFNQNEIFNYGDFKIQPMRSFHDCVDGSGFVIHSNDKKISFLTDTGYVNTSMLEMMSGSDLYFLESNHDLELLKNSSYPWPLKQRIASNRGHLSNDHAGEVLKKLMRKEGEQVVLAHLSDENNLPEVAIRTIRRTLSEHAVQEGLDYTLHVAKPLVSSNVIEI